MSLKEEFLKFRTNITRSMGEEIPIKANPNSPINLDDKVDEFINWYYENMVKDQVTFIEDYHLPREMRDLIEKIAVRYEFMYPEYVMNEIMYCYKQEEIDANNVMLRNGFYANELLDENLDGNVFYNMHPLLKSLTLKEKIFFADPKYKNIVYLNPKSRVAKLHLTKDGIVEMAENITSYTQSVIKDEELIGLNIRDVVKLFKEKEIKLPDNNELEETIQTADKWIQQKEGILDSVMYTIIERGGNRIGPRRAFLFAKEFGRNIDIPMMYAADCSDPELRLFMNEYLKAGGSKDLECYINYFSRASKEEKVNTISIQKLLLTQSNKTR